MKPQDSPQFHPLGGARMWRAAIVLVCVLASCGDDDAAPTSSLSPPPTTLTSPAPVATIGTAPTTTTAPASDPCVVDYQLAATLRPQLLTNLQTNGIAVVDDVDTAIACDFADDVEAVVISYLDPATFLDWSAGMDECGMLGGAITDIDGDLTTDADNRTVCVVLMRVSDLNALETNPLS